MTHDQVRILAMIFYGAAIVVGGLVVGTIGRRQSSWRSWLKVAWMGFVFAMCVRSIFFFASQGTGGLVATGLFMVAMVAAITYTATHGGWAAWWASW
jgi:hypothetical protein